MKNFNKIDFKKFFFCNYRSAKKLFIKSDEFTPSPLEFKNFSDLHPPWREGVWLTLIMNSMSSTV